MPLIESVTARTVAVPLPNPTSFSTRQVHERHYTLVRVRCSDGVEGIGFCYAGGHGGNVLTAAVRELLAPVVVGQDPLRVEGIWEDMYQSSLLQGRVGTVMRAISAVDIALWDRNARAVGLPLHRYLGGYYDSRVPAYASGGYYVDGKGPEGLAEEASAYVDAGFNAVKIKVGRETIADDAARIAAVREVVRDAGLVLLDANNAWRSLPEAQRALRVWSEFDPYWIEEPFSPDDIDNHGRLAATSDIPVASGELEAGRWRTKDLLTRGGITFLQTDAAVCGGITEFRRIAATASSHGVEVCPHWFHQVHVHLVGATPNASFVEYFPGTDVLNFDMLTTSQLETQDGELVLPTDPGLAFDFDDEAVDKYALDEWA